MKIIQFSKTDFLTGFDPELLRLELINNHGKHFDIATAPNDYVKLNLLDIDEVNEVAIRATCATHFAKSPAQRVTDLADSQAVSAMANGGNKDRRFLVEMLYQIDQRLRVLEARAPITKLQFTNALKNIYRDI